MKSLKKILLSSAFLFLSCATQKALGSLSARETKDFLAQQAKTLAAKILAAEVHAFAQVEIDNKARVKELVFEKEKLVKEGKIPTDYEAMAKCCHCNCPRHAVPSKLKNLVVELEKCRKALQLTPIGFNVLIEGYKQQADQQNKK